MSCIIVPTFYSNSLQIIHFCKNKKEFKFFNHCVHCWDDKYKLDKNTLSFWVHKIVQVAFFTTEIMPLWKISRSLTQGSMDDIENNHAWGEHQLWCVLTILGSTVAQRRGPEEKKGRHDRDKVLDSRRRPLSHATML